MAEAQAAPEIKIVNVPITKGKSTVPVDILAIPPDVWEEVILQGLKVLLNRGASKITKETDPQAEEMKAAAMTKANEQVEAVMTSKIKFTGGKKKSGATGAVMTEARRLAKALVKDELKREGIKISHVEASEITKYANAFLESEGGAALIEKAKANLAEREAIAAGTVVSVKGIHISEKLVAASEAKKSSKGTLSAKQAGKVAKRSKGEAQAAMH